MIERGVGCSLSGPAGSLAETPRVLFFFVLFVFSFLNCFAMVSNNGIFGFFVFGGVLYGFALVQLLHNNGVVCEWCGVVSPVPHYMLVKHMQNGCM